jgi:hypothetical protein
MEIIAFDGLAIRATPFPGNQEWFDFAITVPTEPFGGTLKTVFTADDIRSFLDQLAAIGDQPEDQTAKLGGGRAALIKLTISAMNGVGPDLAVACQLLVSEDDPWPALHVLLFERPFIPDLMDRLQRLLDKHS